MIHSAPTPRIESLIGPDSSPASSQAGASAKSHEEVEPSTAFTGEYVVPGKTPQNEWLTHIEGYRFASPVAPGKMILDVACGTGYGSDLLAQNGAQRVVGGDVSPEALAFAVAHFRRENLSFLRLDGNRLPFPPSTFDLVVTFQTLEHMKDPAQFLRECARVLRPDGLVLCSTPMRLAWRPPWVPKPFNPFHTTEFTVGELRDALEDRFDRIELFGQTCIATVEWVTRYILCTSDLILSHTPGGRARSTKLDWLLGYWPPGSRHSRPVDLRRFKVRPLSAWFPGFPGVIIAKAVRRSRRR